jgi:hypothetical protein
MKRMRHWLRLSLLLATAPAAAGVPESAGARPAVIDLAGEWSCRLDREDAGREERWFTARLPATVTLPGSLAENGLGDPISTETEWTGKIVDRSWFTDPRYEPYREPGKVKVPFWLTPVRRYVGIAWYQRPVEIPPSWDGTHITLVLERCHWETRVWVDGQDAGRRDSLSVPHVYDVSRLMTPGDHTLTIRVDNHVQEPVGVNAHSVSDHTQTNWNGITGSLRLESRNPVWVERVDVYPDARAKRAAVRVQVKNRTGREVRGALALNARVAGEDVSVPEQIVPFSVRTSRIVETVYPLGDRVYRWDEFSPNLYELDVAIQGDGFTDRRRVRFGLRTLGTEGTRFTINGRPLFLRGTLECCIFPLTGYPPTDEAAWTQLLEQARAHGLNHLRFHSWCPPEAAFTAADRLGFYYQVECACWTTVGDGKSIDEFVYAEGDRILAAYGNHPSLCLMAYGNEPGGKNQQRFLGDLVTYWKKKDPRRLYTSAAGWPVIPESQFHSTPRPRVHRWGAGLSSRFNAEPPETMTDYRDVVNRYTVPVVSHEIGQWCVYPNFEEIEKYTGVLRPYNFEIFRDSLRANHMLDQARDFLMASGKLQTLCYKEEIEAALRTPGFGGFQLLDLHDFPGQGTALVGVLDPFWDAKGYVTPAAFRRFCGETVPLARMAKRVWTQDETFTAAIEAAHFGAAPIENVRPLWRVTGRQGQVVASGSLGPVTVPLANGFRLGTVSVPLADRTRAAKLTLTVSIPGTPAANDWDFWVYPDEIDCSIPAGVVVRDYVDETTLAELERGRRVLLLPRRGSVKGDARGKVPPGFSSIFWNTAWTRRQPPHTLGILCDPAHPALAAFPTEYHSNWQWWDLVTRSQIMILDAFPPELKPLVQVIDDWFTNRRLGLVFEGKVGTGKLLVCGIDLTTGLEKRPVARQFRHSLLRYMASPAFAPAVALEPEVLRSLQRPPTIMTGARVIDADSAAPGYPASYAIDGDPNTFWHTPWEGTPPGYPHEIRLDLGSPVEIGGFRYVPRQDMANGRIAEYALYLSPDGTAWGEPVARGRFGPGAEEAEVSLSDGARRRGACRYVRFVALSPHKPADIFASLAELEVLAAGRP